jgi:hypothetical protein
LNKYTLIFISFIPVILSLPSLAQIGGDNTYEFLNLTRSPRIAAMGGDFLTIHDDDILLAPTNPSLITPGMHNHLGASFVDFYAGANYGLAAYSRTYESLGSFVAAMHFVNYGEFQGAEVSGERTGTFYGSESALSLGWGRQLDSNFSIGSNLKFIYSSLESYNSFGMAVDVAGSYHSNDRSFTASFIATNIGRQITAYYDGNIEPMPFELQLGISKRLEHLPFRYSILFNHLEKWDLRYDDPLTQQYDNQTGEIIESPKIEQIADNLMRHLVFGGELMIGKSLSLRAGYDYRRRQELKTASKTATVGFSWGIGLRISKFNIQYARSTYHLAGSPNYISISTSLTEHFANQN